MNEELYNETSVDETQSSIEDTSTGNLDVTEPDTPIESPTHNTEGTTHLGIDPIPREDIIENIEIPESAYNVEVPNGFIRPMSRREYMHKTHKFHRPPLPNDPIFMKELNLGPDCNKYGCTHNHYPTNPYPHRCPHNPPQHHCHDDYNEHNKFHRYDEFGNDTLYTPDDFYTSEHEEDYNKYHSYNGYGEQNTRIAYPDGHGYDDTNIEIKHHHHHHHCHYNDDKCYHNPNTPYDNRPMNNNNESFRTAVMFVEQETILSVRLRFVYANNEDKTIIIREGDVISLYYVDTNLLKLQYISCAKIASIVRSLDNSKLYSLVLDCSEHLEHSVIRVPIANIRDIVILTRPSI